MVSDVWMVSVDEEPNRALTLSSACQALRDAVRAGQEAVANNASMDTLLAVFPSESHAGVWHVRANLESIENVAPYSGTVDERSMWIREGGASVDVPAGWGVSSAVVEDIVDRLEHGRLTLDGQSEYRWLSYNPIGPDLSAVEAVRFAQRRAVAAKRRRPA
jgi:hypothetical protein